MSKYHFIQVKDFDSKDNAIVDLFYRENGKVKYLCSGMYFFEKDYFIVDVFKGEITVPKINDMLECLEKHDWDNHIWSNLGEQRDIIFKEKLSKVYG